MAIAARARPFSTQAEAFFEAITGRDNRKVTAALVHDPSLVHRKTFLGGSPLELAARVGNTDGVRILLDRGVAPSSHDLAVALERRVNFDPSFALEEALIEGGVVARTKHLGGVILSVPEHLKLIHAAGDPLPELVDIERNHLSVIGDKATFLLDAGVDPEGACTRAKETPLELCSKWMDPYPTGRFCDAAMREITDIITPHVASAPETLPSGILPHRLYYMPTPMASRTSVFPAYATDRTQSPSDDDLALYGVRNERSRMAEMILSSDLHGAKELIQNGWNVHIEGEFLRCPAQNYMGKGIGFTTAIARICRQEEARYFAVELMAQLNKVESTGITFETELHSAQFHLDEAKVYILLSAGLTNSSFRSMSGMTLDEYFDKWHRNLFDDMTCNTIAFLPAMHRIIAAHQARGNL